MKTWQQILIEADAFVKFLKYSVRLRFPRKYSRDATG